MRASSDGSTAHQNVLPKAVARGAATWAWTVGERVWRRPPLVAPDPRTAPARSESTVPDQVRRRVDALAARIPSVGFRAHNNFGLAIDSSVAAIEAGARQVDGCLRGLGAGAGNAATELLAAAFDRMGLDSGLDVFGLSDAAEHTVKPLMAFQPFQDRESLAIGYARVYSTFLSHAKRNGRRLGLDPREILVELGRRGAVAGQEDWIVDVAMELGGLRNPAPMGH
jgi:4-hydroxy 2-oxovalerate aldolase